MVGQGVLRECLLSAQVTSVQSVVRAPSGTTHAKLTEHIHRDFTDFSPLKPQFTNADACFYCLGVTSSGMTEKDYQHVTYDFAVAAAKTLVEVSPQLTFVFVSGQGTDSSEKGRVMWARVKGATENAIANMPFKAVYHFRPGMIRPLHGIVSKTKSYRVMYTLLSPLIPLVQALAPSSMTSTENIGRAMLVAATRGAPKKHLDNPDINALAAQA